MRRVHPEADGRQENPTDCSRGVPAKLRPFPPIHLTPLPGSGPKRQHVRRHSSPSPSVQRAEYEEMAQTPSLEARLPATSAQPETEARTPSIETFNGVKVPESFVASQPDETGRNRLQPRIQRDASAKSMQNPPGNGHNGGSATPAEEGTDDAAPKETSDDEEESQNDKVSPLRDSASRASRRNLRTSPMSGSRRQVQRQDTSSSLTPSAIAQQSPMVKSRWGQAVWYAAQEAERVKEEEDLNTPVNRVRRASLVALHGEKHSALSRSKRQNSVASVSSDSALEELSQHHAEQGGGALQRLSWAPGPKAHAWKDLAVDIVCPLYVLVLFNACLLAAPPSHADLALVAVKGAVCFVFAADFVLTTLAHEAWIDYLWSGRAALRVAGVGCLVPEAAWLCGAGDVLGEAEGVRGMRAAAEVAAMAGQLLVSCVHLHRTYRAYKNLAATERARGEEEEAMAEGWSMLSSQITDSVTSHLVVSGMLLLATGALLPTLRGPAPHAAVAVRLLRAQQLSSGGGGAALAEAFAREMAREGEPVLYLEVLNQPWLGEPDMGQYRMMPREVKVVHVGHDDGPDSILHLDVSQRMRRGYWGQLAVGVVAVAVAGRWVWSLEATLRALVVRPMERMLITVSRLVKDPLRVLPPLREEESLVHPETSFVEGALIKLAFGEAGRRIIKRSLGAEGAVRTDTKGVVVHAIFGFCDIRDFTGLTEVLQADVGKLVNAIAGVVHEGVAARHGAPNKNIGDAFLLVWQPKGQASLKAVADSALRAYLEIMLALRAAPQVQSWERRAEVQRWRPGFGVRLGYGLHFGWAIECAIGSHKKIDASYLSPHVNLASRLEAATKQYGTPLLMSGEMVNLMSERVRGLARLLDRVTLKGSEQPMDLYTYDVPPPAQEPPAALDPALDTDKFWDALPPAVSAEFRAAHREAVEQYLGGQDGLFADWRQARAALEQWPWDGPSAALAHFIRDNADADGGCPDWWAGYRPLHEK